MLLDGFDTWLRMVTKQKGLGGSKSLVAEENAACFMAFIHSGYFYNASSNPLLLRDAPDYSGNLAVFH